jgi:HEPN domain-containing protein
MEEDIRYWLEIAEYDLGTAEAMLGSARYIYVLFMCQQTLEKALKAHVAKATLQLPPRLHNLLRLSELAALILKEEDKKYLEKLNYYYLGSRYPEDRKTLAKEVTKQLAEEYLRKTKELFIWLKEMLK